VIRTLSSRTALEFSCQPWEEGRGSGRSPPSRPTPAPPTQKALPAALVCGPGGNPLQCSHLENPMDRGAWQAAVHAVAESGTLQSDFTGHVNRGNRNTNPALILLWSCIRTTGTQRLKPKQQIFQKMFNTEFSVKYPTSSFQGMKCSLLFPKELDFWDGYFSHFRETTGLCFLGFIYWFVNFSNISPF